ncbi:MAG: serine hydrolase domain-containing protein [Rikenellaceae bacterium]
MNNSTLILPTITLTFILVLFAVTINIGERDFGSPTPINHLITNEMSDMESTESFDREMLKFMKYWDLKGGSFALMRNDSLLYAKGYGYADVEHEEECEVRHIFRVASVSKLLTATAVMKLIEEGRLSLDAKVFGEGGILRDTMFRDLKYENLGRITVEHLLRHTGGFSSPVGDPAFSQYNVSRSLDKELPLTVDDMVLYATRNRLKTAPGSNYDYSNLGYIVLGKVVEEASGMDYEEYLRDEILAPAGCYDMHIGRNFSKDREPNEVQYYEVREAEPVEAYDGSGVMTMKSNGGNNVTTLAGAGGWVASPVEILRLVASINGEGVKRDILSKKTVKTMTYDSSDRRKKPIGWAIVNGSEWLRSGSMAGTTALIKRQKDGYTWVFVTNSSSWNGHRLSNYMSSNITRYISKVKQWPARDLFQIESGAVESVE